MEKVWKFGVMAANMLDHMNMARNKDKGSTYGLKVTCTLVTGKTTSLMAREYTCGMMAVFILVTGKKT